MEGCGRGHMTGMPRLTTHSVSTRAPSPAIFDPADLVIPSRLTAGWWYGTPRYDPFFQAEVTAAQPLARMDVP